MMRSARLALFVLSALISGTHAEESRNISCRFVSFAGGASGSTEIVTTGPAGNSAPIAVSSSRISKPMALSVPGTQLPFLNADDKTPLATATLPPGLKNALIVFVTNPSKRPGAENTTRALVIDDSSKSYPDGGAFVANFQPGVIRFVLGEHKGMLKPGTAHGYPMPRQRNSFNMAPVIVEFETKESKWVTANESELRFLPGLRYLIIAYTDPTSGRPKIKTFQDHSKPAT